MTKESIVKRLLEQGHIVIVCADRILNKKDEYIQDISDLHRDGPISTDEAIILLKEPVNFNPIMPMNPIQTPPYWYKDDSGTPPPIYCQTSTFDSPFEYSDTKWPKETKH